MAYRAWILWRIESHKAHQERVSRHFRGLGLNLVRPIYSSSNTNAYAPRGMGVALDNLDGLYSAIFTEVNSVEPQAHCWLRISAESKQRNALAYRNGVPAMCLFYPHNKDENLFCWAMTKTWGQNYWGTNWGMELSAETEMLKEAFQFENRHSELYLNPKPLSEVGVLYSARATWLHDDRDGKPDYVRMSNPASTDCWAGWCETLTLANILFDTIGENDLEEERYFDRLRLIIVPNAVCLSERAIQSLKKFARAGGHLIVTCQSGLKNEYGAPRDNYPFGDLIGADYMNAFMGDITAIPDVSDESGLKGFSHDNCFICEFHSRPGTKTLLKDSRADLPIVFMNDYGKGSVVTFAFKPGRLVCVNRHQRIEQEGHLYAKIEFTTNIAIENVMTNVTRMLYRRQALETSDVPRGFAINAFGHDANRIVIHIVNAAGTLSDNNKIVPIPAPLSYPSASSLIGGSSAMTIRVRTDATRAILRSPEFPGDVELECSRLNEYLESRIPDTLLRCYSVVELHP